MFCGLLNAFCNYLIGSNNDSIETQEHRGIIENISHIQNEMIPLSDEEPVYESPEIKYKIKLVDGFEFEITVTESEKEILKVRQPILVIYEWNENQLELPQAEAIYPIVQTNFEIKTWSEVLDECDIDYNTMVKVSTDSDRPLRLELIENNE